jgi:hypothetical protein
MGAYDRAAAARAKMAQVQREMADRRALRDRNFMQRREQARDAFLKQGPVMAQVAKHMGELAKRQKQAGGWATEKTQRDKDFVMGFGGDEETRDQFDFRPTRPAGTDVPPGGIGTIDEEDESPLARSSQAPTPPPAPEAPPAPAPPAPPRARRRPQPQELDDEDDFSNQSSWMQNR